MVEFLVGCLVTVLFVNEVICDLDHFLLYKRICIGIMNHFWYS